MRKCSKCDYDLQNYEHFVIYKDEVYCENCFFNIALKKMNAKGLQNVYGDIRDLSPDHN